MPKHHSKPKEPIVSLITILKAVPDPRVERGKEHDLVDILVIALCAILCGRDSFYDMEEFAEIRLPWLKTFLRLPNGAPSHDTFNRVFQLLDAAQADDGFALNRNHVASLWKYWNSTIERTPNGQPKRRHCTSSSPPGPRTVKHLFLFNMRQPCNNGFLVDVSGGWAQFRNHNCLTNIYLI